MFETFLFSCFMKDFIDVANEFGLKGLNTVTIPFLDQENDNSVSILNEFEEL